jgi:hypothetical protein
MTGSVDHVFSVPELLYDIFEKGSEGKPSELLNFRLVSHQWETQCDISLGQLWKELGQNPPKGRVNILSEMRRIEKGISNKNSPVLKFQALAHVFSKLGAEIPRQSLPVSVDAFQKLQNEICDYDKALETVWSKGIIAPIRELIDIDQLPNAPSHDAHAEAIRKFLNDDPIIRTALAHIGALDLKNLKLKVIPPELDLLTGIQTLDLSSNQLSEVPDFTHFSKLRTLDLSDNQLIDVPDFGHLPNLLWLSLKNNQLGEIPNFTRLQRLCQLHLSNNKLSEVPDLTHLADLRYLFLKNNRLNQIPAFAHLQNLEVLSLLGNTFVPIGK